MNHKVQNKNIGILFTFFSFIISAFLVLNPALAADTAGLLANGVQQFFDSNGNPLTSGKVYFYDVGTSTFKDTYTSSAATTINPNPITLNAGGKSPTGGIYGIGTYRQVVKDRNGNLIWDAVTSPTGGGGSTPTNVGDGNLVGTILPWSGLIVPNQYALAYGQELSRTDYPEFFATITSQNNVVCSASSNILTGLADTSQIPIGAKVELSLCVIAGTTVIAKTSSTVTLSNPSSVSLNAVATFFPFGDGNGSTTFNVPDLRGYTIAGRDNMGGIAIGRLTSTYFNTPGLNAVGGNQSSILSTSNLPTISSNVNIPAGQGSHSHGTFGYANTQASAGASPAPPSYVNSSGGTTDAATLPAMSGTATFTGANNPYSIVQPTVELNYIIKITPDSPSSSATGVMSLGGMTGVISCGSGLLCTGNTISINTGPFGPQLANSIFAGPTSGGVASPTFRSLVSADLPLINLASNSNGGVTGLLPNSHIATPSISVNAITCTLGSTCTIPTSSTSGWYTLQYISSTWTCTAPDGTPVSTVGTTTSGLQECINAMQSTKTGNFRAICPNPASGIAITASTTITFGPSTGTEYDLRGCYISTSAPVIGINFETLGFSHQVDLGASIIQCTASSVTSCVDFNPTQPDPLFGSYGIFWGYIRLGTVYSSGCTATGGHARSVHFNPNGGVAGSHISAIYGEKIEIGGIDGFNGTYNCPTYGVLVDNPTNIYAAFGQNYIYIGYVQGIDQIYVAEGTGAVTHATQSLATNHWDIGSIGTNGAANVGIYTFGFYDQWYANVSVNSGTLNIGLDFSASTANCNYFVVPQLAGTTPLADSGTTCLNIGVYEGIHHN